MAKKVVATLKTGTGKQFTKCIKMVKSEKTGAYMFKEGIIPNDHVKEFFAETRSACFSAIRRRMSRDSLRIARQTPNARACGRSTATNGRRGRRSTVIKNVRKPTVNVGAPVWNWTGWRSQTE